MKKQTLAMAADQGTGFETKRKRTRRDEFPGTMNRIVPRAALCAMVEPHYASPKALLHSKAPTARDFTKVRYRGLAKNANRAFVALPLANVDLCRTRLMEQVRP